MVRDRKRNGAEDLARIPCLQRVDRDLLERARGAAAERRYRKGAIVVRQGSVLDGILLVTGGRLRLYRAGDGARHRTLRILGEGDCLCFAPGHLSVPSTVTAECLVEARVIHLGARQLAGIVFRSPAFTREVMRCLLSRVASAEGEADFHRQRPVRERVVAALLDLAARQGRPAGGGGVAIDALTQEELAACAGTVREVVSRTLRDLRRRGMVTTGRGRIFVHDISRLSAMFPPGSDRIV